MKSVDTPYDGERGINVPDSFAGEDPFGAVKEYLNRTCESLDIWKEGSFRRDLFGDILKSPEMNFLFTGYAYVNIPKEDAEAFEQLANLFRNSHLSRSEEAQDIVANTPQIVDDWVSFVRKEILPILEDVPEKGIPNFTKEKTKYKKTD